MAPAIKKSSATRKPRPQPPKGAIYLYAISLPSASRVDLRSESIDGVASIECLRIDDFDCWISRVDRSEFADNLASHMEDLEWLATVGVRHQRAVAELASKVEILPARFGTVFLTEDSLREHVRAGKRAYAAVFKKITGADEWGVKVFRTAQAQPAPLVEASSGTDYLKRKAKTVMPRSREEDSDLAAFTRALAECSVEHAPGGKASSGQPNLVWHGSFLVRRKQHKLFDQALREFTVRLSDRYRVECSGPWPPYSFVGQHG